jgi:diacylglycerol kinase
MKNEATGLKRIINAFGFSMQGLKACYQSEAAFRQELWLSEKISKWVKSGFLMIVPIYAKVSINILS